MSDSNAWCPSCRATVSLRVREYEEKHYVTERDEIRAVNGRLQGTIERQVPTTRKRQKLACESCGGSVPDLGADSEDAYRRRRKRRWIYRLLLVPVLPVAFMGTFMFAESMRWPGIVTFGMGLGAAWLVQFPLRWLIVR